MRRAAGLVVALTLPLALAACDLGGLLDVSDPDVVTPGDLSGASGLATLRAGALGDFALALAGDGGSTEGQILLSGLLADEFVHSGTFLARAEVDRRGVREDNEVGTTVFSNLQRARQSLEGAAGALAAAHEGDTDPRVAEMWALAGYTYVMFGENYCSGVPYSDVVGGTVLFGHPTTTDETFQRAEARFDDALAATAGDEGAEYLARLGKGRALLDRGRWAEAGAAVAGVPTDFRYLVYYSTNTVRQENGVYDFNVVYERWSLADDEGGRGLPYRSAEDPRVPWTRDPSGDLGFDFFTPQYDLLKYPARDAPIALAEGAEARLIQAEAALHAGDAATMMSLLNEVRERYDLPPLADPGDDPARVDLLFRERAFTLVASSHRLGDLRRLVRQYGRAPDDVFPSGPYYKGGAYGPDTDLPVPFQERNNPYFTGCLDRNP